MPDITPDSTQTKSTNTDPTPPVDPTKTPEPKSEFEKERERLATENANLRKNLKDYEAQQNQLREELSALKKAGHKSTNDWQKLAELNETEAKTWKDKYERTNKAFVNTLTSSKIREEALKNGLKPDLVDLLDTMELPEVEAIIDENNRFNVKGAETAVQNLKRLRPSLFQEAQAPKINAGGASGMTQTGNPKNLAEAKTAYLEARKNRFKDPNGFMQAQINFQKAAIEARKAGKQ